MILISNLSDIDRKALKKPDSFTTQVNHFFDSLMGRTNILFIVLAILIGIGVVTAYTMNHFEAKASEARNALYLAEKTFDDESEAADKALESDSPKKEKKSEKNKGPKTPVRDRLKANYRKIDVDTTYPKTIAQFKDVVQKYGQTRSGYEARIELGDLYYHHQDYKNSTYWYNDSLRATPKPFDRAISWSSLGYSLENEGKNKEAIEAFEKSLTFGQDGLKGDLLMAIARNAEALHDTQKAFTTYNRVTSELQNTDYAKNAEIFKTKLPK